MRTQEDGGQEDSDNDALKDSFAKFSKNYIESVNFITLGEGAKGGWRMERQFDGCGTKKS